MTCCAGTAAVSSPPAASAGWSLPSAAGSLFLRLMGSTLPVRKMLEMSLKRRRGARQEHTVKLSNQAQVREEQVGWKEQGWWCWWY